MDRESFERLNEFVDSRPNLTRIEIMEMLLDPEVLSVLYPGWGTEKRDFKVGETVGFTDPRVTNTFGPTGTVVKVSKSNLVVKFQNGKTVKVPVSLVS
jgi:hypothetical protein